MVKKTHMTEIKSLASLTRLTISENAVLESSIIEVEQFQDMTSLIHVKIMQNVTLMSNCFKGCTSLLSVEFAEVPLISEGSFRNCSSLNTLIIPDCKELRGDYIFSGCSNLRDVGLISLLRVDSSGSKIFEGCNQLTIIRLPSKEPLTFHKDTFIDCSQVKLVLPKRDDYLAYDDESHVVDDVKEDEKWCGIKIDSEFLPQFLVYKINGIEHRSRKLTSNQNSGSSLKLLANENEGINTNNESAELKVLELIGGLVDSNELKDLIKNNPSIEKFEARIGTLSEISSGTFNGCNLLKEIIIHTEVYISVGALQNIPSLIKLEMVLQQTIRSDDLAGDINLQEISLPLVPTIPSRLFANLTDLKTIKLETASLMHNECFMNCVSIEKIDLKNMKIINGDSHFEGCSSLKTIDLSSLSTVDHTASRIFMNCNQLSEITLGNQPPNRFNEDIFTNAGTTPNITLPSLNDWKNYYLQCTLNEENKHYMWYGYDTGIVKEEEEISCPETSECSCPEQMVISDCSCPEQTECPPPNPADCSCPEQTECPPSNPADCSCPEQTECPPPNPADCSCPGEFNCPSINPADYSCPEPPECQPKSDNADCSCSEPTECQYPPTSTFTVHHSYSTTMSIDITQTYILRKSVSFSMGPTISNIYLETYINGEYTMILTKSFVYSFRPYVIQFYSLTNSQTLTILEINKFYLNNVETFFLLCIFFKKEIFSEKILNETFFCSENGFRWKDFFHYDMEKI